MALLIIHDNVRLVIIRNIIPFHFHSYIYKVMIKALVWELIVSTVCTCLYRSNNWYMIWCMIILYYIIILWIIIIIFLMSYLAWLSVCLFYTTYSTDQSFWCGIIVSKNTNINTQYSNNHHIVLILRIIINSIL